jgi:hypothetical protein
LSVGVLTSSWSIAPKDGNSIRQVMNDVINVVIGCDIWIELKKVLVADHG